MFDFAVAVCTKKAPACETCPLHSVCRWAGVGDDPAAGSAGVSSGQSRFEGSDRQVRGRITDALRAGPVATIDLARFGRPSDTPASIDRIVAGLIADGLAIEEGGILRLP